MAVVLVMLVVVVVVVAVVVVVVVEWGRRTSTPRLYSKSVSFSS